MNHLETCTNPAHLSYDSFGFAYNSDCQFIISQDKALWGYLAIAAVIGVALLAASLLLYRRRRLESAGDFAAVKPIKTVFTVLVS